MTSVKEKPHLEHRSKQPYVAIRAEAAMAELGAVLPPLIGQVLGWLSHVDFGNPHSSYL